MLDDIACVLLPMSARRDGHKVRNGCVGIASLCMVPACTKIIPQRESLQAEQSQAVSQEAVVSYAKELQDMDPDYRPPADIPAALR